MPDSANTDIKNPSKPIDKSDVEGRLADHHARIAACEAKLGIKPQPGAAAEETAARPRKRH